MKAEKDKKTGKWLIQYRYTDWQGKRRKSTKRGFATKREAEEWLRNFLITQKADFDMKFENFQRVISKNKYSEKHWSPEFTQQIQGSFFVTRTPVISD